MAAHEGGGATESLGGEDTDRASSGGMLGLLDRAKVGSLHKRIWALSAMGIFIDGFDFFIIGVAAPLIDDDWSLAGWQLGLVTSAAVLGAVVGASTLGRLTDRIGRKKIYLIDLCIFVVFAAASALAWDFWSLIAFRFLLGVGIGADYPISATYVAEVMPSRVRGRFLIGAFSFQALGMLFGAATGVLILTVHPELVSWRIMLAVGIIPAVISALMRLSVPESPRWLLAHDRRDEAAEVVAQLTGEEVSPADLSSADEEEDEHIPYRDLFRGRLRRRTVLTSVPWFFMDIATYGIGLFTPTILAAILVTSSTGTIAADISSAEGSALLDIFLVVGFGLALVLVERLGRITLQVSGFVAMAFGLAVVAVSDLLPGGSDANLPLVFAGFIIFNLFMNLGPNATTYVLPAEVFPTSVRASGHGFAAACGKAGAATGAFFFPVLNDAIGRSATVLIIAGGCLVAMVVTLVFKVETTGQSLSALDDTSE